MIWIGLALVALAVGVWFVMRRADEPFAVLNGIDVNELYDAIEERMSGNGHKIGGYPYFIQTDPRTDGVRELLFQLDSDDEIMWGDVGVGSFFITPEDLAKRDFRDVLYTWDCS